MGIQLSGLVVIVGNYGCGKSEVSINLAIHHRRFYPDVRIADLDLVNPYFRSREARLQLKRLGVEVILPSEQLLQADLPILSPAVAGLIRRPGDLSVLDVGGEETGATVLAALGEAFRGRKVQVLQVVNPKRPDTSTVEKCLKIRDGIQRVAKLEITGVIGNANLIEETRLEDLLEGCDFVRRLSEASGLPIVFVTAPRELMPALEERRPAYPVLPIDRQLVPPWRKAAKLAADRTAISDG